MFSGHMNWIVIIMVALAILFGGLLALFNLFKKYMEYVKNSICISVQEVVRPSGLGNGGVGGIDGLLKNLMNSSEIIVPQGYGHDHDHDHDHDHEDEDELEPLQDPKKIQTEFNSPKKDEGIKQSEENNEPHILKKPEIEELKEDIPLLERIPKMKYEELRDVLKNTYGLSNIKGTKMDLINKIKSLQKVPSVESLQPDQNSRVSVN
jgi:hypothetical protein